MASVTVDETVRRVIADVLDLDPRSIDDQTRMEDMERWDSANHITLVLALEEEFGIAFEVPEIEGMITFQDIVATVEAKL
ncbi:MAG: phosphopantetheine-binding protein [Alphaproteobacteria bacterium]